MKPLFLTRSIFLIFGGGLFIRLYYLLNTPIFVRGYDTDGHIPYISYMAFHFDLPPINWCWESYQPPLYYYASGFILNLCKTHGLKIAVWYYILQIFSVLLFMGFLITVYFIIKRLVSKISVRDQKQSNYVNWLICLLFALITFWPFGIFLSITINNDIMFYLLFGLWFYFLLKWFEDNTDESLYRTALFALLALITKGNGLILFGILGIVFLSKFIKTMDKKKYVIKALILMIIFMVGFTITFERTFEEKINGTKVNLLVPNSNDLHKIILVNNKIENYLYFDIPVFINETFANPFGGKSRQYFWNFLFKTALVGQFSFETPFQKTLIRILSIIFLGMLVYSISGIIIFYKHIKRYSILFLTITILIIALMAFRILIPASCSGDFRYIFPVIIPSCFLFFLSIWFYKLKKWVALELVGNSLAVLFICCSVIFVLSIKG